MPGGVSVTMSTVPKPTSPVEPSGPPGTPQGQSSEPVPQRPLFMNGYPSLVPGDIGANPLHDIRLTLARLRQRWQQFRLGE